LNTRSIRPLMQHSRWAKRQIILFKLFHLRS